MVAIILYGVYFKTKNKDYWQSKNFIAADLRSQID
jgi:hypothetical protein